MAYYLFSTMGCHRAGAAQRIPLRADDIMHVGTRYNSVRWPLPPSPMPQSPDGTAAHRIWQIPELLLSVMEACHIAKNRLAGVASVSRSFWAIAVPLLWETIPGRHDITEVLDFFSVTAAENDEVNVLYLA